MGRRFALLCALTALVIPASAGAAPLRFGKPIYLDQTLAGGEPIVFTDTIHHTIVYSSHEGTTHIYRNGLNNPSTAGFVLNYRNQVNIWTSSDGGATWQLSNVAGTGFNTTPDKNTGFSDPDLAQDEGGRIYNTGIDLANDALFSSADGGKTWDQGTINCHDGDRPWLAGGIKDQVWLATNANVGSHEIYESKDGGQSCGSTPAITDPGGNGKMYFDHANKIMYEPTGGGGSLGVATWHPGDKEVVDHKAVSGTSVYAHWPAIAIDGAGTVYLVWDTDPTQEGTSGGCNGNATPAPNEIKMVYSKDQGNTWSLPVTIARPVNHRVFWPWIAAGDAGKVSVVWYETDKIADLSCQQAAISVMDANVTHATDDSTRKVQSVVAVDHAISDNNICQSGTTCVATGEDRRLGDFFTNAIDEKGCVMIGTGDVSQKDPTTEGERATSLPLFVKQIQGPRLIGTGDCNGGPGDPDPTATPPLTKPPANSGNTTKAALGLPSSRRCLSRRVFRIHLRAPKGQTLASAKVTVAGKAAKVTKRKGRLTAVVDLRKVKKGTFAVKVVGVTGQGRAVNDSRRYHTCKPKKKR